VCVWLYGLPHVNSTFLKALNRCFKDYGIDDDEEKKERTPEYAARPFKRDIERLPEYRDLTSWEGFQKVLLREYRYSDSDQLLHKIGYLEKYVKDFKSLVDGGHVT